MSSVYFGPSNEQSFSSPSSSLQKQQHQSRKRPRLDRLSRRNVHLASQIQATPSPWIHLSELEAVGRDLLTATTLPTTRDGSKKAAGTVNYDTTMAAAAPDTAVMVLAQALERVEIWKLRSHRLPQAIEATHALATCLFTEHQHESTTIQFSTTTTLLSLSYASAVLRCINGFTDVLQQSRATAASVAVLSQQLGIPTWLVDTRHQSTHNQLPSLSILRMAAVTLLHYLDQVYWQPISQQRREWYQLATDLLQDYEKASTSAACSSMQPQQQAITTTNNPPGLAVNTGEETIEESDEDESDEETENGDGRYASALNPYLGTSFNRFAVLLEDSKKKKKQDKGDVTASTTASTTKRRKAKSSSGDATTTAPWSVARKFVRSPNIPADIVYETALSFFLSSTIPSTTTSSPESSAIAAVTSPQRRIRQLYMPLLLNLTRHYPGFASALLVRLVDDACYSCRCRWRSDTCAVSDGVADYDVVAPSTRRHEQDAVDTMTTTCWVEYLLSDEWCQLLADAGGPLQHPQDYYPVRALYHRCVTADTGASRAIACQLRHKLLRQQRVMVVREKEPGVSNGDAMTLPREEGHDGCECPMTAAGAETTTILTTELEQPSAALEERSRVLLDDGAATHNNQAMSLEEMEALLTMENDNDETTTREPEVCSNGIINSSMILPARSSMASDAVNGAATPHFTLHSRKQTNNEPTTTKPRAAWVLCDSWEPCAIGTLPGYPG